MDKLLLCLKFKRKRSKLLAFLTFRTGDGGGDDEDGIEEEED